MNPLPPIPPERCPEGPADAKVAGDHFSPAQLYAFARGRAGHLAERIEAHARACSRCAASVGRFRRATAEAGTSWQAVRGSVVFGPVAHLTAAGSAPAATTPEQPGSGSEDAVLAELTAATARALDLYRCGEEDKALPLIGRVLEVIRKQPPPQRREAVFALNNLASLCLSKRQLGLAEELLLSALAVGREVWGTDHPHQARCRHNLALLLERQGKLEEAEGQYRRALAILDSAGAEGVELAAVLGNLGGVAAARGNLTEALALLQRSLELRTRALGAEHPDVGIGLAQLADVSARQGRSELARAFRARADALLRKADSGQTPTRRPPVSGALLPKPGNPALSVRPAGPPQ
jgi:tetratricopeptide (TPR) repeat protein